MAKKTDFRHKVVAFLNNAANHFEQAAAVATGATQKEARSLITTTKALTAQIEKQAAADLVEDRETSRRAREVFVQRQQTAMANRKKSQSTKSSSGE